MTKKGPTVTIARNSISGRFVTKRYAETHPKTTEVERRPKPSSPPAKPTKK